MDMTRRQFALALAAATYLRPSLFEALSPLGVPRTSFEQPCCALSHLMASCGVQRAQILGSRVE
jgi:hypothetical protein